METAMFKAQQDISHLLNPMLRSARLASGTRARSATTLQGALTRFKSLCVADPSPLTRESTRDDAIKTAFALCLAEGEVVKGGCNRDLIGCFDSEVRDIDLLIPKNDIDPEFRLRSERLIRRLATKQLYLTGKEFRGANCLELFFCWDSDNIILPKKDLHQDNVSLISLQLARSGGFHNKNADFNVCQVAVR